MAEQLRRAQVSDTVKMSLLYEVSSKCPICRKPLIKRKSKTKDPVRVFDVAHIYPLHAREHEINLLKNEEKLCENIDSEGNFIVLCKECHKMYDTDKTVDEYRYLVSVKKSCEKLRELSEVWDAQTLHKDISIVAEKITAITKEDMIKSKLPLKALKLMDKINDDFGMLNEIKVNAYITNFYIPIKENFRLLELERKASYQFICSQVRSYYLALVMEGFKQNEIYEQMVDCFMVKTGINERSKAEVLVSYFIQNCEVYSEC
ncbi:ABC-three component system protein [Pantoea agglomerans]|uniref:ABC-three component system protein n=1 Tax=Enterobacter agglomerans TaxID=549 RepID=UPI00320A9AF4